jgi:signal transduction histidine kinase
MTWQRHRRHGPPPWWPANEPWPPASRGRTWRHRRGRFVRRVAVLFALLLILSAVGAVTLVSKLLAGNGFDGAPTAIVPVTGVAVVGIVLVGLLLAGMRRFAVPLGDIVEAANRVADGDYSTRVAEQGPPSLRSVGSAFNTMASRLEAQDRQRRDLMADIAHELRTPLSVIQGRLEGLLDGVYPRDDRMIGEVIEETRQMARLIDDLRTLANAESGTLHLQKEPTDMAVLIQDVARSFSGEAQGGRVSIGVDAPADLPLLTVDPVRIREVVANLVSNALNHTPAGGTVSIAASVLDDRMVVTVTDTGSGIAPEELPKIFDRFYKGRSSRGSGLGLTIARNLVTAHAGAIRAQSAEGTGTTITLTLPLVPP